MSSRRRAGNNRGRSRASKTNLDDLDGALTSMIGSSSSQQKKQEVKLAVEDSSQEQRFTMHSSNDRSTVAGRKGGIFTENGTNDASATFEDTAAHTSNFEKHQVNYGATKYIKPWRTGTKSQQLPPKTGHKQNSGKGGKTYE